MHDIPILYEDNDTMVINKPAGLVVNRAESVKGETLQDWADEKLKIQSFDRVWDKNSETRTQCEDDEFYNRSGIVHRLDKETSGILIVAKKPSAFFALQKQFAERLVEKHYLALIHGTMPAPRGEITVPIARLPWKRERFGVLTDGKESSTGYKTLATYQFPKGECFSLLELAPKTGRTHQIRVHLKYMGHPIVSDSFYVGSKRLRGDLALSPRLFLHAARIRFLQPQTDKYVACEAPLPPDLSDVLSKLEKTGSNLASS